MYYYLYNPEAQNPLCERISFPEVAILYYLKKFGISFQKSCRLYSDDIDRNYMSMDFFLNDYNLAVEYDGKMYLSELVNIKKETSTPLEP